MKYSDEEIRRNSEAAEAALNPMMALEKNPDGTYKADALKAVPCQLPCRGKPSAEEIVKLFDKPEDLAIIADETPNGKRIGTKVIVHKIYEKLIRRNAELTMQVFKEAGFIIGDQDHDKFIPIETMRACQAEVRKRLNAEFGENN